MTTLRRIAWVCAAFVASVLGMLTACAWFIILVMSLPEPPTWLALAIVALVLTGLLVAWIADLWRESERHTYRERNR